MSAVTLRMYAAQCPFMLRSVGAAASAACGMELKQMAQRCPIMGRALAHTQAINTKVAEDAPTPNVQVKEEVVKSEVNVPIPEESCALPAGSQGLFYNYDELFDEKIRKKKEDHSYRYFNNINRLAQDFPRAENKFKNKLTVWCSNDYLGMSRHPVVLDAIRSVLDRHGAGSGGTRNIAGNGLYHEMLEEELAQLHRKSGALVFTSCYVANDTTLQTLAQMMPGCIIFSDSQNHASMIA
eukprot:Ihof_evm2s401 gene=Ihof_evmTU2s401